MAVANILECREERTQAALTHDLRMVVLRTKSKQEAFNSIPISYPIEHKSCSSATPGGPSCLWKILHGRERQLKAPGSLSHRHLRRVLFLQLAVAHLKNHAVQFANLSCDSGFADSHISTLAGSLRHHGAEVIVSDAVHHVHLHKV